MKNYQHKLELQVRDYECDLQGIVNNAVYQNYLEHARHQFLLSQGVDFVELSKKGINLVVVRIEFDYKSPLRPDDRFWIGSSIERVSKIKFAFDQAIYRQDNQQLILQARVVGTAIDHAGRPCKERVLGQLIG
ncbi:MAG TPA: acyl-CoA thioesterase [Pseudomonadales bacterium]